MSKHKKDRDNVIIALLSIDLSVSFTEPNFVDSVIIDNNKKTIKDSSKYLLKIHVDKNIKIFTIKNQTLGLLEILNII